MVFNTSKAFASLSSIILDVRYKTDISKKVSYLSAIKLLMLLNVVAWLYDVLYNACSQKNVFYSEKCAQLSP